MAGAHMEGVYVFEVWDDQTSSAKQKKSLAMEVTRLTNRVGTLIPMGVLIGIQWEFMVT